MATVVPLVSLSRKWQNLFLIRSCVLFFGVGLVCEDGLGFSEVQLLGSTRLLCRVLGNLHCLLASLLLCLFVSFACLCALVCLCFVLCCLVVCLFG